MALNLAIPAVASAAAVVHSFPMDYSTNFPPAAAAGRRQQLPFAAFDVAAAVESFAALPHLMPRDDDFSPRAAAVVVAAAVLLQYLPRDAAVLAVKVDPFHHSHHHCQYQVLRPPAAPAVVVAEPVPPLQPAAPPFAAAQLQRPPAWNSTAAVSRPTYSPPRCCRCDGTLACFGGGGVVPAGGALGRPWTLPIGHRCWGCCC